MSEAPWRERLEIGLAIKNEVGPSWIALEGEDFFEAIELAVSLTEQLSVDWVAVFCCCGNASRPISGAEIATALRLDPVDVTRCLRRLEDERLVEAVALSGAYKLAQGKRSAHQGDVSPSAKLGSPGGPD